MDSKKKMIFFFLKKIILFLKQIRKSILNLKQIIEISCMANEYLLYVPGLTLDTYRRQNIEAFSFITSCMYAKTTLIIDHRIGSCGEGSADEER